MLVICHRSPAAAAIVTAVVTVALLLSCQVNATGHQQQQEQEQKQLTMPLLHTVNNEVQHLQIRLLQTDDWFYAE